MKYLLSILFLSIIYLGGLLFIILPHDKVSVNEKRSLSWKLNFFITGYRMIGINVFKIIFSMIKSKYFAKKTF